MAIRVEPAALRLVEELFVIHVDAVFNVAYRVVWSRPDAEDVVQATFIKAFTRLDQLKDRDRIRPWLLQVAYREAITVIRRRRDVPVDPAEFPERRATGPGPDDVAVAADVASALGRALASLSEGERMAVVLRDVEQLPMREVATVMGIGRSAAKMRVHRGRQALRSRLEGQDLW
ncbi:MAG: sigma-70 family RNA polymerase sigma factor [Acidimicrobiia bacterium]|nr:sigma-70 family RNA polymerase sigma factor [Acidimicrobiia bacterium]MDH5519429.1 sigma-70 family RNA polymerase sigma factor [Acidimicrobiia bacterium]